MSCLSKARHIGTLGLEIIVDDSLQNADMFIISTFLEEGLKVAKLEYIKVKFVQVIKSFILYGIQRVAARPYSQLGRGLRYTS